MSHVNFKKLQWCMSPSNIFSDVSSPISEKALSHINIYVTPMSHVKFKKCRCPHEFRSQSSVAVKYLHCKDKDAGSNPTATRNAN